MTLPFYESVPDLTYRFGDIVRGFTLTTPYLTEPQAPAPATYRLDVSHPNAAVLSPCCSIRDSKILLSPLIPIRANWLDNPYFREDLTSLNRAMTAQQSVTPAKWQTWPENEQLERLNSAPAYAELGFFVYCKHPLLPTYFHKLHGEIHECDYYMIDFRRLYSVDCPAIKSPKDCPITAKILQLSIPTRRDLRDKLAYFFGRTPTEDSIPQTATPPAGLA
jgi:hypothetical protein